MSDQAQTRDEACSGTMRQCALTRERRDTAELIRFALSPDNQVTPDLKQCLPGRGVWLLPTRETVARAVAKRLFPRAFRGEARTSDDLPGQIEMLLVRAGLEALSLANKAGQVTFGFAKIEEAIGAGRVIGLIHASDASPDGVRKLDGRLFSRNRSTGPVPSLRPFTTAELDLATGRSNVVHAALIQGGAAKRALAAAERLMRYRTDAGGVDLAAQTEPNER